MPPHGEDAILQRVDDVDAARARGYALLAALLMNSPDAGFLARLRTLHGESTPFGWAQRELAAAAARTDAAAAAHEYSELFVGLVRGELLPYASYYRTGFLQGTPLAQLRNALLQLGVERAPGSAEPEDHAATILEVMAGLAAGELRAPASFERQFFEDHVLPWMPRFFVDLEAASSADFYAAVGAFGRCFIDIEAAAFSMCRER